MKVRLKKSVDIPPEIKAFTDRVLATPLDSISEALNGFTWKYEKGDFYQWVPLFNHFDAFFDQFVRGRSDLNLQFGEGDACAPFPVTNTLAVLKVTARILENCTNKHLYQSYEHLTDLLAAAEKEVVFASLQALVAFLRKTHHSSVRFHGYPKLNSRLFDLCRGWGGKEEGLDLVACVNEDEEPLKKFISRGTMLHFEFYADNRGEAVQSEARREASSVSSAGQQVVHIQNLDKDQDSDHDILRQLVQKHRVPADMRFRLLTRIRIAHGFGTLEGRRHLVRVRLLAFCVLFQSNSLHEEMLSFFVSEPEFMNELVGLVQNEEGIPLELRTFALRALAVQLVDRSRHAAVINAIGVGGQNGVLSILLQDSINYITCPDMAADTKPKYNASFVEALLSLVGALVSSSSGSVALSEAGFIPALLPLIQDSNPTHVSLVCTAVKILEAFMDFSSPASAMFRGLGGLTFMIKRLESEVGVVTENEPEVEEGGEIETEVATTTAPDEGTSSAQGNAGEEAVSSTPKQIPYVRRLLLKSLLRAIALASYAPTSGTGRRPDESDAQTLYACLRTMFLRSRDFGGALFALAASVVTDLIHHDPLCFRSLHAVGVPDAFLTAVREGVTPSSEAVCCVPNNLVALCLNSIGLELVKETHTLDCLVNIFTSKQYLRALSGDTASILGAGIDELLRHVPALKDEGIEVVIAIFQAICILGGDAELIAQHSPDKMETSCESGDVEMGSTGEQESEATNLGTSRQQQETSTSPDSVSFTPRQRKVAIPQEVWDRSKEKGIDTTLPECISHATKMLESLLSNQETTRRVVENGGIDLLLRLYRLPRMPPAFGSSSQSHTMLQIFRAITPNHQHALPKKVKDALVSQLEGAIVAAENVMGCCVPTMEPAARDDYVRLIASTGGLTGIAAMVARSAIPMLVEICKGDQSLMSSLGQLERMVLSQLVQADLWKERKEKEKKEREKDKGADAGARSSTPPSVPSADVAMAGTEEADVVEVGLDGDQDADGDGDQMDLESVEVLRGVNVQRIGGGRLADTGNAYGSRGHRKKSLEDVAYDVLQHFVVSVRGFYMAVAKSIHTPARRREESFTQPTMPMRAATLGLALVLEHNLDYDAMKAQETAGGEGGSGNEVATPPNFSRRARHLSRLVEEVMMVLFDNRRHYCHTLILNYFVAVGGMASLTRRFQEAVDMLWEVVEAERAKRVATNPMSEINEGGNANANQEAGSSAQASQGFSGGNASFLESVNHLVNLISGEGSPLRVVEGVVLSMLGLFEQLTNPRLLCQSTQAATLLTVPLPTPDTDESASVPTSDAETFIKDLQACVLGAIMPVWTNPLLPHSSPQVTSSVITILNSCSDGTGTVATALRSAGPIRHPGIGRGPPPPDRDIIQQISEMGFSAARAEEALRRVGHNSVELAMEWLITHPEEPVPPPVPPAVPPEVGADGDAPAAPAAPGQDSEDGEGNAADAAVVEPPPPQGAADEVVANQPVEENAGASGSIAANEDQSNSEDKMLAQALAVSLSEIRTGDGSGGVAGPSTSNRPAPHELEKVEIPKPIDLVTRAVAVLEKMPVAAFSLTDLVMTLCNRDGGKDRALVLTHLISSLRGEGCVEDAVQLPAATLNARSHLLVVLLSESPQCRETAAEKGVVRIALEMLEAWEAYYKSASGVAQISIASESGSKSTTAETKYEIPMWVEALLLMLDTMAQTQPKQTQRAQAASGLINRANQLVTPTAEASAGGVETTPASGSGPASVPGLFKLLSTWQPCGLLSVEEHQAALQVCIRLLSHLHTYGNSIKLPGHLVGDMLAQPDPAATTQAVLQVMARLTRCHKRALEVLHGGGVDLMLTLPAACLLPKHEAHISTILKHILEDPGTLQTYMEAEIKNLLTSRNRHNLGPQSIGHFGSGHTNTMPVRTFLQNLASVINRDPRVFMEAVSSTCSMEASSGAHTRQSIALKKSKSASDHNTNKDSAPHSTPHRASKSGKRVVPVSFVEVIDKLLDLVSKFNPAIVEKACQEEKKASQKKDGGSRGAGSQGVDATEEGRVAGSGRAANRDATDPFLELSQWLMEGRVGPQGAGDRFASNPILQAGSSTHAKEVFVNHRDTIMQVMILRMLSEFCLMYTSTVGVLLKRDTETGHKDGEGSSAPRDTVGLLKRLLHTHLACQSDSSPLRPGVSDEASRFLQAVCIRSGEGRKRIVTEIVATINEAVNSEAAVSTSFDMPFVTKEGVPSGFKIKAFIDLIGSLLSASSGNHSENRSSNQTSGLTIEMIRSMRDAGVVSALTRALRLVEMDHPEAPKAINSIIKPLEVLTRSIPAQSKRSGGSGNPTTQGASTVPVPRREQGQADDQAMTDAINTGLRGHGDELGNYVSEAGPQAMAVAGQMMDDVAGQMMDDVMEDVSLLMTPVENLRDIIEDDDDDDESPLAGDEDEDDDDEMDEMDEDDERLGALDVHLSAEEARLDARLDALDVRLEALHDDDDEDDHDDEDDEVEDEEDDHVVVDDGDEEGSEGMGHEDDGDSERSRTPDGVLDEDEEEDIEDEDEDDEGEEGSADMELDDGEDWDDEDSREYAEALDRIEGEIRGEASNLARGYVRLQPHLRSMFGSLLGNFMGSGGDIRIDRRGFRYRPPRFDRSTTNNIPYQTSVGPSQHRLLTRPPVPPPNSTSSRSIGTLTEALMGAGAGTSDGGLGWRRIAFSSGMGGDLMNSLPDGGDSALVSFRMDDQLRPLTRMGGAGGWQLMTGLNPSSMMDMDYRPGRDPARSAAAGASSWLSGLQGTLEQHIVEMLRENPPQQAPQAEQPHPEQDDEMPPTTAAQEAADQGDVDDPQDPMPAPPRQEESPNTTPQQAPHVPQPSASLTTDITPNSGEEQRGGEAEGPSDDVARSEGVPEPTSTPRDDLPERGAEANESEPSPSGAAAQALTPEFVQNAIRNTLRALARDDLHQHQDQANDQAADVNVAPESTPPQEAQPMEQETPVDEDEEMADVIPGLEAGDDDNAGDDEVLGSSGSEGRPEERGEGDQAEPIAGPGTDEGGGGEDAGPPLDPEIMERAQASGIDPTFLQALPRNLQIEVLSQHGVSVERLVNPVADAAPAQAAAGNEGTPPAQTTGGAGANSADQVDPEFLAALPPDIREEVLETQRLGEQRREVERRLAQGGPDDVANIVASLPEDIREEVLLYSGPDVLANLPPELIAEGQRLRDRHMRHVAQDHEDGMARNFFFRRLRQDRDQANPRSTNRSPTTYGTRKDKRDEMEGPPPLEETALVTLVELLRLSQPIHKGQLQKLFLNLCSRAETRSTIIQLLLSRLTESSRMAVELEGGMDRLGPSSSMQDLDDEAPMRVDSQDPSASPLPKSWPGTPPTVTRRILDLLSYLARHQNSKVAEILLELRVPVSKSDDTDKAASMGKLPVSIPEIDPKRGALEVLLEMLGQPLCQRSVSTLEQNLHLLEVVMQCATAKAAANARQVAAAEASRKQSQEMDTGEAAAAQEATDAPDTADGNQGARASGDGGGGGSSGNGGSGGGGAPTTTSRPPATGEDEGPSTSAADQSVSTLWELSDGLLRWLPGLLGKRGLSDRAYRTCASVVKLLVEAAPRHRMFMMLELQKEAGNLTEILVETLERIGTKGMDGSSTTANAVGSTGALILRILHAVESLIKVEHQGESEAPSEIRVVVQQVALKLDALWAALSSVIAEIEKKIRHSSENQTEANAAAKILPPGAAQILPLVESFYVLCSAQGCLPAPPLQAPADSADLGNVGSEADQRAQRAQASASSSEPRALVDKSQPLMRFSEAHRVMLNAFLRQTPALLEGSLSPLLRAPRLIDFDNKRLYFRSKVRSEERHYGTLRINVRREHVFEDSFHQLRHRTPEELRCKLSVQFTGEEGIDAGGVSREWYQVMSREIFNPNLALFVAVPEGTATFQPNPNSVIQNDRGVNHLDFFKFVGRIIGKALYDGQLVDVHFTRSFYKHMLNLALTYEDLEAVDPDYYKQMKWTLEHDITDVLDQVFAAEVDFFGRKEVVELKPEGAKMKVTEENKMEYVNLMTKHKMTTAIRNQIKAFQEGFWELVPKELVVIFNDNELELLISGLPEVDIADLKANTEYSGYTAASPVIQWFWEVVEELGKEELALLLQFVTGTSKVPLDGFQSLQGISGPQKFQIHKSYAEANRLPSAHTCFNQLDLPEYPTKEKLKDRLLVAVHEGNEGFGFG